MNGDRRDFIPYYPRENNNHVSVVRSLPAGAFEQLLSQVHDELKSLLSCKVIVGEIID